MLRKLLAAQHGPRGVIKRYQTRLGTTVEYVETWDQPGAIIVRLFFRSEDTSSDRPQRRAGGGRNR